MKRKVILYFFILSARASSLWILHLLVLPIVFCQKFCGLIFWHFLLKLSHKFTNQTNSESLALMILNKTHVVGNGKHRNMKEDQKIKSLLLYAHVPERWGGAINIKTFWYSSLCLFARKWSDEIERSCHSSRSTSAFNFIVLNFSEWWEKLLGRHQALVLLVLCSI